MAGFEGKRSGTAPATGSMATYAIQQSPGKRTLVEQMFGSAGPVLVQQKAAGDEAAVHAAADRGTVGAETQLPHIDKIQQLFGGYDVTGVRAHTNDDAGPFIGKATPTGKIVQRGASADSGWAPLERATGGAGSATDGVQAVAAAGLEGAGERLPHRDAIQRSFGHHDIGEVQAHTGAAATAASRTLGAEAFASGHHVAFDGAPSLHTAAHEAAHVVQQRGGVQLKGGVGQVGDVYEQHADAVADAVVQGKSAESLLDAMAGPGGGRASPDKGPVQAKLRLYVNGRQTIYGPGRETEAWNNLSSACPPEVEPDIGARSIMELRRKVQDEALWEFDYKSYSYVLIDKGDGGPAASRRADGRGGRGGGSKADAARVHPARTEGNEHPPSRAPQTTSAGGGRAVSESGGASSEDLAALEVLGRYGYEAARAMTKQLMGHTTSAGSRIEEEVLQRAVQYLLEGKRYERLYTQRWSMALSPDTVLALWMLRTCISSSAEALAGSRGEEPSEDLGSGARESVSPAMGGREFKVDRSAPLSRSGGDGASAVRVLASNTEEERALTALDKASEHQVKRAAEKVLPQRSRRELNAEAGSDGDLFLGVRYLAETIHSSGKKLTAKQSAGVGSATLYAKQKISAEATAKLHASATFGDPHGARLHETNIRDTLDTEREQSGLHGGLEASLGAMVTAKVSLGMESWSRDYKAEVSAEGAAVARAGGLLEVSIGPGGARFAAGFEAQAVLAGQAGVALKVACMELGATITATLGAGASFNLEFSFVGGKLSFRIKMGASLLVGGEVEVSASLDVRKLRKMLEAAISGSIQMDNFTKSVERAVIPWSGKNGRRKDLTAKDKNGPEIRQLNDNIETAIKRYLGTAVWAEKAAWVDEVIGKVIEANNVIFGNYHYQPKGCQIAYV